MVGTILNALGILIGWLAGMGRKKMLSEADQVFVKLALGVAAMAIGLRIIWVSVEGDAGRILKQLLILLVALTIGRICGRVLRLQKLSNSLGQYANGRIQAAAGTPHPGAGDALVVCAILFCVAPLAIVGAIHDGLQGVYLTLLLKAALDGLAVMSFVPMFGWGALLSILPVVAYQGAITLAMRLLLPFLEAHGLTNSIMAAGGFLVFCVALVIFQAKKIELASYLPSLVVAPLGAWWIGW